VVLLVLVLVHLSCVFLFLLDGVATVKLGWEADGTTANAARHTAPNKQQQLRRRPSSCIAVVVAMACC
jgi:hypothetical protein